MTTKSLHSRDSHVEKKKSTQYYNPEYILQGNKAGMHLTDFKLFYSIFIALNELQSFHEMVTN